ncbi:MAG: hypothetical protein KTR30_11685 [Saprospiraceae bacterium]|nr:hypothetical protein [Saprospiraceae bacterium]
MKHSFYELPRARQWTLSIVFAILGAVLILSSVFLCMYFLQPWLLLLLIPLYFVFAQLLDIPFGHLRGTLKHYSPMLIVQPISGTYYLHTTTLFDQLFALPHKDPKLSNQQQILIWILDGFLALIDDLKEQPDLPIVGTTHFLSLRRAQKLGFTIRAADPVSKFILIINYLNLVLSMSITKGHLRFPKLNQVRRFEISTTDLIRQEPLFRAWRMQLIRRTQRT